jgi:hypothetical protein
MVLTLLARTLTEPDEQLQRRILRWPLPLHFRRRPGLGPLPEHQHQLRVFWASRGRHRTIHLDGLQGPRQPIVRNGPPRSLTNRVQ